MFQNNLENTVIVSFRQIRKWGKNEGQQREFFPARRAKFEENVAGALDVLNNRQDFCRFCLFSLLEYSFLILRQTGPDRRKIYSEQIC